MKNTKIGFTLIELLVVVLIIGILAAVAVPQYQKAVWKSRAAQLLTATRSLATAQETFHMGNGGYATAFSDLEIDFPLTPRSTTALGNSVSSTDAVRGNSWMEISITGYFEGSFALSTARFIDGPYKGGGFMFPHYSADSALQQKMYCTEMTLYFSTAGSFCTKLFGATNLVTTRWSLRFYEMP
jgi:prepilin-type N-terminal cleavage/methylation domain-containing protein